jgi:hypothetical protein
MPRLMEEPPADKRLSILIRLRPKQARMLYELTRSLENTQDNIIHRAILEYYENKKGEKNEA